MNKFPCFHDSAISYASDTHHNEQLQQNLVSAYKAIKFARSRIKFCSTHVIGLISPKYKTIKSECEKNRANYWIENEKLVQQDFLHPYLFKLQKLRNIVHCTESSSYGRCYEYASLVLFSLLQLKAGLSIELIYIENGDHVFVVLDRDPLSDLQNAQSWGKNAVVIDAWFGNVFPAADLENQLHTSPYSDADFIAFIPYDKQYHKFKVDHSFLFQDLELAKSLFHMNSTKNTHTFFQAFTPEEKASAWFKAASGSGIRWQSPITS